VIFLGVICSALLEIIVRFRLSERYGFQHGSVDEMFITDEKTGLRIPRPNMEVRGSKIHIKINSLGFRGEEL